MISPTLLAALLGLAAAITLAIANASVKASGDILMSRATMSTSAALIVLPAAFLVPLPDAATWGILALSIPAHAIYQATLVKAMSRGDLSLVFPVMRGGAPLITALMAFLVLQEAHSALSIFGLLIASASTITFALPETNLPGDAQTRTKALLWAVLCSACIAMYNVIDAIGVRTASSPFTFIVWLFLLDSICINLAALWFRRTSYLDGLKLRWRYGAIAGAMSVLSFGMTLYAFSISNITFVSALRETSVVFATLLGWRMLKEKSGYRRLIAASSLTLGLILFQLGQRI